jgi:hypothetical protein
MMVRSTLRTAMVITAFGLALGLPTIASAHNRAHLILPDGTCITVGSEKSVNLPPSAAAPRSANDELDLRPETLDGDEVGTSFAATEGNSAIEKFGCP